MTQFLIKTCIIFDYFGTNLPWANKNIKIKYKDFVYIHIYAEFLSTVNNYLPGAQSSTHFHRNLF